MVSAGYLGIAQRFQSASSVGGPAAEDDQSGRRVHQMQRAMEELQVSLSEKDAEIIRLNICLGDERKRNNELNSKSHDMPLQMASSSTPKRLSRSSSRGPLQQQVQAYHH